MRTIAPEWPVRAARHTRYARAALLVLLVLVAALAACEAPRGTIGAVIAQDDPSGRLFVRDAPPGVLAFERRLPGEVRLCLFELAGREATCDVPPGSVVVRQFGFDEETRSGAVRLPPFGGVVLSLD